MPRQSTAELAERLHTLFGPFTPARRRTLLRSLWDGVLAWHEAAETHARAARRQLRQARLNALRRQIGLEDDRWWREQARHALGDRPTRAAMLAWVPPATAWWWALARAFQESIAASDRAAAVAQTVVFATDPGTDQERCAPASHLLRDACELAQADLVGRQPAHGRAELDRRGAIAACRRPSGAPWPGTGRHGTPASGRIATSDPGQAVVGRAARVHAWRGRSGHRGARRRRAVAGGPGRRGGHLVRPRTGGHRVAGERRDRRRPAAGAARSPLPPPRVRPLGSSRCRSARVAGGDGPSPACLLGRRGRRPGCVAEALGFADEFTVAKEISAWGGRELPETSRTIEVARTARQLTAWGNYMGNCIGSYMDDANESYSLVALRDPTTSKSVANISMYRTGNRWVVEQALARFNQPLDDDLARAIRTWAQSIDVPDRRLARPARAGAPARRTRRGPRGRRAPARARLLAAAAELGDAIGDVQHAPELAIAGAVVRPIAAGLGWTGEDGDWRSRSWPSHARSGPVRSGSRRPAR